MKLLKQPLSLFGFPAGRGELEAFNAYMLDVVRSLPHHRFDEQVVELIDIIPQLFHRMDEQDMAVPPECFKPLVNHMNVVFECYKRAPSLDLENMILSFSSEYTYHLMRLQKADDKYPGFCMQSRYRDALLGQNIEWGLRWAKEQRDDDLMRRALSFINQHQDKNPYAAYVAHKLHARSLTSEQALADARRKLKLLVLVPENCIRLIDDYPGGGATGLDGGLLLRSLSEHPGYLLFWAEKFPGKYNKQIEAMLLKHPAWVADYIERCKPENPKELWLKVAETCTNPWLSDWIAQWGYSRFGIASVGYSGAIEEPVETQAAVPVEEPIQTDSPLPESPDLPEAHDSSQE